MLTRYILSADSSAFTVSVDVGEQQRDPTFASPVWFRVVFSKPATDFTLSTAVSFGGSTVSGSLSLASVVLAGSLSGGRQRYNVSVSGWTSDGLVVLALPAGVVHDAATNPNLASTGADTAVLIDATPPTVQSVARLDTQHSPTNQSPVRFNVTLSEPVLAVSPSLFSTAGSTASVGAVSVSALGTSGRSYQVSVPVTTPGLVKVAVSAPAGVTDLAGNALAASALSAQCSFDNAPPSVARFARAAGQAAVTNRYPVLFNLTFSEPVLGVSEALVSSGGSGMGVSIDSLTVWRQSPLVWAVGVNATGVGTIQLALNAPAGVTDVAGNALAASVLTVSADFGMRAVHAV